MWFITTDPAAQSLPEQVVDEVEHMGSKGLRVQDSGYHEQLLAAVQLLIAVPKQAAEAAPTKKAKRILK